MNLWRISNHHTLNGEGGRRAQARWHSGGQPIVYLAASPPGALLEILVHLSLEQTTLPPTYTLLRIDFPEQLRIARLKAPASAGWQSNELLTRKLGDAWLASKRSALAEVPSAILPETSNYLLNPLHSDTLQIKIKQAHTAVLDARLLRLPARLAKPPLQ